MFVSLTSLGRLQKILAKSIEANKNVLYSSITAMFRMRLGGRFQCTTPHLLLNGRHWPAPQRPVCNQRWPGEGPLTPCQYQSDSIIKASSSSILLLYGEEKRCLRLEVIFETKIYQQFHGFALAPTSSRIIAILAILYNERLLSHQQNASIFKNKSPKPSRSSWSESQTEAVFSRHDRARTVSTRTLLVSYKHVIRVYNIINITSAAGNQSVDRCSIDPNERARTECVLTVKQRLKNYYLEHLRALLFQCSVTTQNQ